MALCSLCCEIPFASLPDPPPNQSFSRVNDNSELPALWLSSSNQGETSQSEPLGFAWHKHFGALALSAASCALCSIIQDGVAQWLGRVKDAGKNPAFVEFNQAKHQVPDGQQLWVTRRYGDAPGMLVFARNIVTSHVVYLLTGVSFAVDDSKMFMYQK
jgi:hypothetical protein